MQTYLALAAVLFSYLGAAQFLEEPCGMNLIGNKIIGGFDAGTEAAAWMVAVSNDTHFLCGGTLIHKRFVLTAAHCINSGKKLIVKLGAYNRSQPTAQYNVLAAIPHPLYNNFLSVHDVGLLKLANSVVFNALIHPICIILNHNIKSQVELTRTFKAFGWGEKGDGKQSDILQAITLNHLKRADCHRRLGMNLTQQQICAGVHNGDTCRGDSGGPLTNNVSLNNGSVREVQFGIVSYGTRMCNDTGVYTDVSSYVDWIKESIVKDMWLYSDCGGESIASNFQANIIGLDFKTQGVLITDRFVISNARDLRGNTASLKVIVIGMGRSYGEYRVDSVFKHQKCSDNTYDIALLRLNGSVMYRDGFKPICILSNVQIQERGEFVSPFTVFDYVRTEEPVQIDAVSVAPIDSFECSQILQKSIETDEVCFITPRGMSQKFGIPGDILGKSMVHFNIERFVLFGFISYSYNHLHVVTNIMRHTEWIANTVELNQL
ncbi:serine protease grass-like [Drosophila elegans]|uniref:serine protease grass-like n=1 Tax=Drosophila elegans TaxID=30023 RepID=UPI001BC85C5D|nr:serine protease grass-like [Drosophila elegans]